MIDYFEGTRREEIIQLHNFDVGVIIVSGIHSICQVGSDEVAEAIIGLLQRQFSAVGPHGRAIEIIFDR